jgi:hypothetical protein
MLDSRPVLVTGSDDGGSPCRPYHAYGGYQQPVNKLEILSWIILGWRDAYLDGRAVGKATPELEQGTAELVLHGRTALLMVDGSRVGVGVGVGVLRPGGGARSSTAAAREETSARSGGRRGDGAGTSAAAVGERHVGWLFLCL